MKKILFPTDFSKIADNAFRYALRIAKQAGAEIHVLHVYELPSIRGANLPHTMEQVYEDIKLEEFQNFNDKVPHLNKIKEEEHCNSVQVNYSLEQGATINTIIMTANKDKSDYIIMGTDGAKGLKAIFKGTNSGEVLENSVCPVLVVPSGTPAESLMDIENIVLTISFQPEEEKALQRIIDFAAMFGARIHCVNVDLFSSDIEKPEMEALKRKFVDYPNLIFKIIQGADLEKALQKYLLENNIDILAMVTHRRNFFQELFSGSQTKKMAYHSSVPILAIQAHLLKE